MIRRTAGEILRSLEARVARLEGKTASSTAESVANEIIQAITASSEKFKVKDSVKCEISGYQNASLILEIDVVNIVDLPESAFLLSFEDQKKVTKIVRDHLKYQEKHSRGTHLLSSRATRSTNILAEHYFEEDNKWTRQLKDNPAVQLGYDGQLVHENISHFNKLQEVKMTHDDKIEWSVTANYILRCVLKSAYR